MMVASPASVDLNKVEADILACEQFLQARRPSGTPPPRRLLRRRQTVPPAQPASADGFADSCATALQAAAGAPDARRAGIGSRRAGDATQHSTDHEAPRQAPAPQLEQPGSGSGSMPRRPSDPTIPLLAHIMLNMPNSRCERRLAPPMPQWPQPEHQPSAAPLPPPPPQQQQQQQQQQARGEAAADSVAGGAEGRSLSISSSDASNSATSREPCSDAGTQRSQPGRQQSGSLAEVGNDRVTRFMSRRPREPAESPSLVCPAPSFSPPHGWRGGPASADAAAPAQQPEAACAEAAGALPAETAPPDTVAQPQRQHILPPGAPAPCQRLPDLTAAGTARRESLPRSDWLHPEAEGSASALLADALPAVVDPGAAYASSAAPPAEQSRWQQQRAHQGSNCQAGPAAGGEPAPADAQPPAASRAVCATAPPDSPAAPPAVGGPAPAASVQAEDAAEGELLAGGFISPLERQAMLRQLLTERRARRPRQQGADGAAGSCVAGGGAQPDSGTRAGSSPAKHLNGAAGQEPAQLPASTPGRATPRSTSPSGDDTGWQADEARLAALAAALGQRRPGDPPGAFEIDTALLYSPQSSGATLSVAGSDAGDSDSEAGGDAARHATGAAVGVIQSPGAAPEASSYGQQHARPDAAAASASNGSNGASSPVASPRDGGKTLQSPAAVPPRSSRSADALAAALHDSVASLPDRTQPLAAVQQQPARDEAAKQLRLQKLARLRLQGRPAPPLTAPPAAVTAPQRTSATSINSRAAAGANAGPDLPTFVPAAAASTSRTSAAPQSSDGSGSGSAKLQRPAPSNSSGSGGSGGGARLQRLAAPPVDRWARCEAERQEREAAAMRHCSFRPKTAKHTGARVSVLGAAPSGDRLHSAAAAKAAHIERLRAELQATELAGCTFAPQLTTAGRRKSGGAATAAAPHKPLHERLADVTKQRQEKLLAAREAEAKRQAVLTAPPAILPKSAELAAAAALRPPMLQQRRPKSAATGMAECTFRPALNAHSERLLEDATNLPADFKARQAHFDAARKAKLDRLAAEKEAGAGTFSPDTGNAAQVLALSAAVERLWESPSERTHRLAVQDAADVRQAREGAQAEYYRQFNFKPAINPRSRQLAQSHDLEELVNNPKREATRAAAECAAEEAFRQSHTFRPDTSASRAVERGCDGAIVPFAGAATADRLAASKANRRARLLADAVAREAAEFEECTFQPGVAPLPLPSPDGVGELGGGPRPVVVHGLNSFLERKDAARRMAEEQAALEAKVFHTRPRLPPQHTTVPQPFSLSSAEAQERSRTRQAQLAGRAAIARAKTCPFRPNAATELEVIEALLTQDDSWLSD